MLSYFAITAHAQYTEALRNYLELGASKTNFFSSPITRDIYDESAYKRMIKCCSYMQCHTQVSVYIGLSKLIVTHTRTCVTTRIELVFVVN